MKLYMYIVHTHCHFFITLSVNHIFCETGDKLSAWFTKFLLYFIIRRFDIVCKVIRICSLTFWYDHFVVVLDLVNLPEQLLGVLPGRTQIWKELLNSGELEDRHLILHFFLFCLQSSRVKLLVIRINQW